MLKKGQKFPEFKLENQNGEWITNETIKGRKQLFIFIHVIILQLVQQKHVTLETT